MCRFQFLQKYIYIDIYIYIYICVYIFAEKRIYIPFQNIHTDSSLHMKKNIWSSLLSADSSLRRVENCLEKGNCPLSLPNASEKSPSGGCRGHTEDASHSANKETPPPSDLRTPFGRISTIIDIFAHISPLMFFKKFGRTKNEGNLKLNCI